MYGAADVLSDAPPLPALLRLRVLGAHSLTSCVRYCRVDHQISASIKGAKLPEANMPNDARFPNVSQSQVCWCVAAQQLCQLSRVC